jgi:predicted DNA-binding protein YlxM (UPF0122 family)
MPVDTLPALRSLIDGDDQFMTGHQLTKVRRPRRKIPDWSKNEKSIQIILQTAFPKLKTDSKQRKQAGRWARVIQLYFRSQKSYRETAEEMNETRGTIHNIINRIGRVSIGKAANKNRARKRDLKQTSLGGMNRDRASEPQN